MASNPRITRSIPAFSTYLEGLVDYLLAGTPETNAARLGIPDEDVQVVSDLRDRWIPLYRLYENKRGTRTSLVTEQLYDIIDEMKSYNQESKFLDRVAASTKVTATDLSVFNIKDGTLAKKRQPLTEMLAAVVVPKVNQLGGGVLAIRCFNNLDSRRGIVDDADSVEMRYHIGETAPESPDDEGLTSSLSTKASFKLALGAKAAGKTVHIYFRWNNTKYPALAGPWSILFSITVV